MGYNSLNEGQRPAGPFATVVTESPYSNPSTVLKVVLPSTASFQSPRGSVATD